MVGGSGIYCPQPSLLAFGTIPGLVLLCWPRGPATFPSSVCNAPSALPYTAGTGLCEPAHIQPAPCSTAPSHSPSPTLAATSTLYLPQSVDSGSLKGTNAFHPNVAAPTCTPFCHHLVWRYRRSSTQGAKCPLRSPDVRLFPMPSECLESSLENSRGPRGC